MGYTKSKLIEAFGSLSITWRYKDLQDEKYKFSGEAFPVIKSNQKMHSPEIIGKTHGDQFISYDNKYIAFLNSKIGEIDALAIQCTDGEVVIIKHHQFIEGRRIEGYWYSNGAPHFSMPVPNKLNEMEAKQIFDLIKKREEECEVRYFRGSSLSRIDDTPVGSSEFVHENWLWPEGYAEHYVLKNKVKPSDDFLDFLGWIKN